MRWSAIFHAIRTVGIFFMLISLILPALTACAPATPVRRSALIPAAYLPSRIGRPLDTYEFRVMAQVNPVRVAYTRHEMLETLVAEVGDPGVFIPRLHVGASLYVSVFKGLEIGGQLHYASFSWADPNVTGVLPFPQWQEREMFMGGIGIRYSYTFDTVPLTLSAIAELNFTGIPQATYICENSPCDSGYYIPGFETPEDRQRYRFYKMTTDTFLYPNLFVQVSYKFYKYFHVYGLLGAERNVKNIGFDPSYANKDNPTLEGFWVGVVGAGIEFNYRYFFVNVNLFYPFDTEDKINFGLSMAFQTGVNF